MDSPTEVAFLAAGVRQPQALQVRVSPDIDFHEPSSVTADLNDQMLGFARTDGQAADAIRRALDQPLLYLVGLHCHIGSQVTDASLYGEAIRQMVPLMAEVRARHGIILTELDIGGGHGVPYASGDPELDLDALRTSSTMRWTRRARPGAFPAQQSWSSRVARSAHALVSRSIGSCGCSHNPAAASWWLWTAG